MAPRLILLISAIEATTKLNTKIKYIPSSKDFGTRRKVGMNEITIPNVVINNIIIIVENFTGTKVETA